ncbi:hypothetical protein GCM10009660_56260 [Catellatospora bangladeshensis]
MGGDGVARQRAVRAVGPEHPAGVGGARRLVARLDGLRVAAGRDGVAAGHHRHDHVAVDGVATRHVRGVDPARAVLQAAEQRVGGDGGAEALGAELLADRRQVVVADRSAQVVLVDLDRHAHLRVQRRRRGVGADVLLG